MENGEVPNPPPVAMDPNQMMKMFMEAMTAMQQTAQVQQALLDQQVVVSSSSPYETREMVAL